MTRKKLIWFAPLAILGIALFIFIGGELVMQLWNWLLPSLFGWRRLDFWEALGILLLCRILFGGLGSHGGRSHMRGRVRQRIAERMGERMGERWANMTPEERERFQQGVRSRCGGFSPGEPKPTD